MSRLISYKLVSKIYIFPVKQKPKVNSITFPTAFTLDSVALYFLCATNEYPSYSRKPFYVRLTTCISLIKYLCASFTIFLNQQDNL